MTSNFELIPEASNLIESQRSIGYTFETAIADIVDNSVSALAKEVKIYFSSQEKYVAIIDDGFGMVENELLQAMRYGSKSVYDVRSKEDLGRFGLGLKMASFSQCRKLTVISKKENKLFGAIWDLDLVRESNSWIVQVIEGKELDNIIRIEELKALMTGTLVIWEKFDKLEQHANFEANFDEALDRTENHLSLVYHRYLKANVLTIFFNSRKIDYVDPFFSDNKATQPKAKDIIPEKNRNAIIEVKPYIVPYQKRLSQKERHIMKKFDQNQLTPGLYIYRNRRLIAWGKWFRLVQPNELANLAKIQIDIPNTIDDLWDIDVKKSQLNIPSSLRLQLREIIRRSIGESEKVYKHRGTKRNKDNLQYVFDRIEKENKISYRINLENPIIRQLQDTLSDSDNRMLTTLLNQIENNLPLESIQYDMASNKEIEKTLQSDDEVYEEVMLIISNQSSLNSKRNLLDALKYSEVYSKNLQILKRIEEELND